MVVGFVWAALIGPALAEEPAAPPAEGASTPSDAPASAEPARHPFRPSFGGTEELRFRFWHVDDHLVGFEDRPILDYIETVDHLDLTAGTDHVSLALRGDAAALWLNQYILDDELHQERPLYADGVKSPFPNALFDLEKVTLKVHGKLGQIEAGDAYVSFGRGIALNLVKNTDIDIDTSVRGLKGLVHLGAVDLIAVSGVTNPQQIALENQNVDVRPDLYHVVNGLRAEVYGLGPATLGAHGVMYQYSRGYEDGQTPWGAYAQPVDAAVVGANLGLLGVAGVDWYAEGDWFKYLSDDLSDKDGYEGYLSAAAYPGKLSILVEGKRSKNTEEINTFTAFNQFEMAAGPTLEYERVITEDSSAALNSNDLWGGRVRVDWTASPAPSAGRPSVTLIPSLTQAVFRDADLGGLHFNRTPETISHTIASLLYIREEVHVLANAGFRVDRRDPSDTLGDLGADEVAHADLSVAVPIAGPVSAEIDPSVLRFHWGDNAQQQADYTDFSATLALKYGSPYALIFYADYSDNPLVDSVGNLFEDGYGAVEAQWKPTPATTLKAFYGAYRAGIHCAGGQCRQLPGFNGAKVSLTASF